MGSILRASDIYVSSDGVISGGLYRYELVKVVNGSKVSKGILQVCTPWVQHNAIHIFWNAVNSSHEFRIYKEDSYVVVKSDDGYFCDDGRKEWIKDGSE